MTATAEFTEKGLHNLAKRVEAVLNQILEAQMTESLRADRHELRVDARPCLSLPGHSRVILPGAFVKNGAPIWFIL